MLEEKITINISDLEELVDKEVSKIVFAKRRKDIFVDLDLFDLRIKEINESKQELVEFAKSHEGSWVDLSDLVSRRDRYTNGFLTVTPLSPHDPNVLLSKLVALSLGRYSIERLNDDEKEKARKTYREFLNVFLTAYKEHLNEVIDSGREAVQ